MKLKSVFNYIEEELVLSNFFLYFKSPGIPYPSTIGYCRILPAIKSVVNWLI